MELVAQSPELEWTREQLLGLADRLDVHGKNLVPGDFNDTVKSAATALRFMAALTVQNECRQRAPFKPLYQIRNSEGAIIWTCGHSPAHESPA